MTHLYFAYGSNLSTEQMNWRCKFNELVGPAYLEGYKLDFTFKSTAWGGGCADIVQKEGGVVWGLLYRITDEGLKALDRYEGHPTAYRRFETSVRLKDGTEKRSVWTYEVVEKKACLPTKEYLGIILDAANWHGFPKSYQDELREVWDKISSRV